MKPDKYSAIHAKNFFTIFQAIVKSRNWNSMKISKTSYAANFGRAFTAREKEDWKKLRAYAGEVLGIQDTSAVVFDFNMPSKKGYNTGTGTTFSDKAAEFAGFTQDMTGITSIQTGPQGKVQKGNVQPYSGTSFAIGAQVIDPVQLTKSEYLGMLQDEEVRDADRNYKGDKIKREYRADWDYALADGNEDGSLLHNAYMNYIFGMTIYDDEYCRFDIKFNKFKEENKDWLEKETAFTILSRIYGTDDFNEWPPEYRDLYSEYTSEEERRAALKQLRKENKNDFQYEDYKQYIAYLQQKEAKAKFNSMGIKLNGDCILGFSKSEIWGNKDCFSEYQYYGGPDNNMPEGIQMWGLQALDYSRLGDCSGDASGLDIAGKLLYDKFCTFFKRYDGIRVDAAWQFISPFIYEETISGVQEAPMPSLGRDILNILNMAAEDVQKEKFDSMHPDNIMLELVGMSADEARELTMNEYPHLYSTSYAEYDETPAQFMKKGYQNGSFYIGIGNHDNDSLVNLADNCEKRRLHTEGMKRDYGIDTSALGFKCREYSELSNEQKERENFRNAKFAEIFTSAKQFFTLPDMFGMSERINISGVQHPDNWTVRIPENYEEFYYSQLSKGFGLNMPKALEGALKMLHIKNPQLEAKLAEAAEILRQSGPLTEKEADEADKKGLLQSKFSFNG